MPIEHVSALNSDNVEYPMPIGSSLLRRRFLATTAAATSFTAVHVAESSADQPLRKIRIGVMGLSRGLALAIDFGKLPGVDIAYLCDVDDNRLRSALRSTVDATDSQPEAVKDFRRILDDPSVDALICAAPNHWHGPATIMACKAGKHVYVEKPCSHNPQEGEWMVEAAVRFGRCVQMGTQRRSSIGTREAISKLHAGAIGNIHLSRCYYNSMRGTIGRAEPSAPPNELEYDLWQGPAPRQQYRSNIVHYNWHWFWHWGGGELANNGVHGLDLCRWGLQVDYPNRTVSSGGRYWFDDDQETPDTQTACFEFSSGKQITWSALSCNRHRVGFFCAFYGDGGTLQLDGDGRYRIFDRGDKMVEEGGESSGGQVEHLTNFIDCVRREDASGLNQPIEEGHKSTLLCHLGNIAQRTGRSVFSNSSSGHILDDDGQKQYWAREYEPSWRDAVSMP
jgi:predicted dehydrogenase